ncbi:hypothetical protein [Nocardia otitidiscaviarum]|uniref:hypothetical protein n=1 Tax=Nocardia otitidiscaviarum TaxID=1823 RepID=UPI002455E584|nr:hypothetical protein [Nocardia otitidiscaviarum]
MDATQIRELAIERIARADYTNWLERVRAKAAEWGEACEHLPWNEAPDDGEWGRDRWRRIHAADVDALGDLLPTKAEEELAGGFVPGVHTWSDIDNGTYPPTYTVRRYVTVWRPIEGTETA